MAIEKKPEEKTDETKPKPLTDVEKAGKIIGERDKIQKGRTTFEKQWLINIAFLHGKQYFQISRKALPGLDDRIRWEFDNLERKKKIRRIDNYILPLYRSVLARFLRMKAHVTVDATTNSDRDKSSAKISQEVLEDHWQMVNKANPVLCQDYAGMILVLKRLFGYLLAVGTGYLKPYFNQHAKVKHYLAGKVGEDAVGETETKVLHAFDVFEDPLKQYLIEQSVMNVDRIEEMYDKKVKAEDVGYTDTEQKLMNLLEGSTPEKFENAARIFEKWQLPSKKYPDGWYEVCTAKEILVEEPLPPECKGRIPYFKFDYLDLMLSPYAQGFVEQLISLQEELNYTLTRLAGYKKYMAGKVMVSKGAGLEKKWDDETGQLIFYNAGHKPTYEAGPNPPSFIMLEIRRIKSAMEDIAASHDASMGRVPGGVKSGVGMEQLAEGDISQLGPVLMGIEQKLAFYAETVLDIVEAKYSEPRLLAITGDTLGAEVKTFKGENVTGNRRIKVSLGSSLPYTKEARQTYIMKMEERKYITPEKARELMEFGDVEGLFHSLDETAQKEEIQMMLKGGYEIVVEEWDDHTIHIKIITDFMKSKQFMELDEKVRQQFIAHRQQHQQFLLKEQEAQATMEARAKMAVMPKMPRAPA